MKMNLILKKWKVSLNGVSVCILKKNIFLIKEEYLVIKMIWDSPMVGIKLIVKEFVLEKLMETQF